MNIFETIPQDIRIPIYNNWKNELIFSSYIKSRIRLSYLNKEVINNVIIKYTEIIDIIVKKLIKIGIKNIKELKIFFDNIEKRKLLPKNIRSGENNYHLMYYPNSNFRTLFGYSSEYEIPIIIYMMSKAKNN